MATAQLLRPQLGRALEDCLWTLELQPPRARVTFVTDSLSLLIRDDMSFGAFLDLLNSVAEKWSGELEYEEPRNGMPFNVVLQDSNAAGLVDRIGRVAPHVPLSMMHWDGSISRG